MHSRMITSDTAGRDEVTTWSTIVMHLANDNTEDFAVAGRRAKCELRVNVEMSTRAQGICSMQAEGGTMRLSNVAW
jgi:hypothetical protein